MLDRSELTLAVAHADVSAEWNSFSKSARYFHAGKLDSDRWREVRNLAEVKAPLRLGEHAFVTVEGNVRVDITMPDGGAIVIYGDVNSCIQTTGQCEIVIAGDILDGAVIAGDGILHVFVGGDCLGELRSSGSCTAWVQGHLRGQVSTGHPSCHLYVQGDCTATIKPSETPSLLFLQVDGFMAYAALEATAAVGHTVFNASIGRSDRPAGLYPDKAVYEALRQHRSHNRWVIRR